MLKQTVFVAGHCGMVGSAIVRKLQQLGYCNILTAPHEELDLLNQQAVIDFFTSHAIDQVYLAAAKVGGIYANQTYPADFIYNNLLIEANVIHAAHQTNVNKLLFLGSSCIYPKLAEQPIREEALLTGYLEPTNEPYAIAKIAGIKLCESYNRQYNRDYRSVMPTNLYGPNDSFHPENSHVIPALIRRFYEAVNSYATSVTIWGSGTPRREFLHVDDMASACTFIMQLDKALYQQQMHPMLSHINVGVGKDCSIKELANLIAKVMDFRGDLLFDSSKPDGCPRKLLDISKLTALGWKPSIDLRQGIEETVQWFKESKKVFEGKEK